ncbi:hypothetical protein ACFOY8_13705 [Thalassospira xianhensis]|uniref:Cache domain-containing protein n=1 Tax=Thalassospira xianhensis MCCC 1A02616 TaxID=1177929 RepID=A0A367UKV6_9PROT|nr:hypothetical protein [Thalassospira xianhensis]RCK07762.1 hypothetical protein TH5_01575 [Thalassospira xianhensis MCCC 1A02616]
MKWFLVSAFIFLSISDVGAEERASALALENSAITLVSNIDGVLHQAEGVLRRSADLLRDRRGMSEIVVQATLAKYADDASGVRAILFIDDKGILQIDSTRYPADKLNLSDRDYFIDALGHHTDQVRVGAPVTGQQSGVPFLPVTTKVASSNGNVMGVLIAVMTPDVLVSLSKTCEFCFISVFTQDGSPLITVPSQIVLPSDFFEHLGVTDELTGTAETRLKTYPAQTVWRKSTEFPIIVTSSFVTRY